MEPVGVTGVRGEGLARGVYGAFLSLSLSFFRHGSAVDSPGSFTAATTYDTASYRPGTSERFGGSLAGLRRPRRVDKVY